MTRAPLTVTIITLNEERNIARALRSVDWADEVVVIDSGSTDRTVEIARSLGAKVLHNPWPGYGKQKNFAQAQASHAWVLNIDADEEVPPGLRSEILQILEKEGRSEEQPRGFAIPRKTRYLDRWILHGGWYPNYLVRLADRRVASWTEPDVHEELRVSGPVARLREPLHHYTFSCIEEQVETNLRYSRLGYHALVRHGRRPSVTMLLLKPLGKFIETFVLKRGFLDGIPGLIISINAAHSIFLKYAYLFESTEAPAGQLSHADPGRR
jgi:glycosyltransferase involved in cell wall biosynthesis